MALVRLRRLLECSSVGLEVALWKGSCDMRCTSRCGLLSLPRIFQVAAAGHVPACALSLDSLFRRTTHLFGSPFASWRASRRHRRSRLSSIQYASSLRTLLGDRSRRWAMHRPKPPQLDSVRHAAATAKHCALFYIRARKSRRPISCYAGISQYAGSVGPAWRRPIKSKLPGDQPKQQRVVRLRVPLAVRLSHLHMLI